MPPPGPSSPLLPPSSPLAQLLCLPGCPGPSQLLPLRRQCRETSVWFDASWVVLRLCSREKWPPLDRVLGYGADWASPEETFFFLQEQRRVAGERGHSYHWYSLDREGALGWRILVVRLCPQPVPGRLDRACLQPRCGGGGAPEPDPEQPQTRDGRSESCPRPFSPGEPVERRMVGGAWAFVGVVSLGWDLGVGGPCEHAPCWLDAC